MIVPMKKVTLLTLASDREKALEDLQRLGVLHISGRAAGTAAGHAELKRDYNELARYINVLDGRDQPEKTGVRIDSEAVLRELEELFRRGDEARKKAASLLKNLNLLDVWGDFDGDMMRKLRKEKGIHIYLCSSKRREMEEVRSKYPDAAVELLSSEGGVCRFAVVSLEDIDKKTLPLARIPGVDVSPVKMRNEYESLRREIASIDRRLDELAAFRPALVEYARSLEEKIDFASASDRMAEHGGIAVLEGFIPDYDEPLLRRAAKENGWGVMIEDPADGETVPTLVKIPRWARVVRPLFEFLGISPGYDEIDVSAAVLVFFAVFSAMIIGDAGYGLLMTLAGIVCWRFTRHDREKRRAVKFLLLLGVCTVIWGMLTANFFGSDAVFGGAEGGCRWLRENGGKNVQVFCFALALAQLTLGHVWKCIVEGRLRGILSNAGWILILWGNFFLSVRMVVYPGEFPQAMYYLYGAGLFLVVIAGVNWKDPGDIFNFPFNCINSFVDTLSYIRLYAVGVAGGYIASSFNGMAFDLAKISPVLIIGTVIVLFFGHGLNICLSLMSVLVHGVRLNTLEFSNHVGLKWSGTAYSPFRRNR